MLNESNNDFYKTVLEATHDEIFVTDGNGVTLYCNKSFEKHYGMNRSEIMGKNVLHLFNNGYCSSSPIPIVIQGKKEITMDQETITGRKLVITATPVFNESGKIIYIVENCRDITEIEKIKHTLEKTKQQMEIYKSEVEFLRKKGLTSNNKLIFKSSKVKSIIEMIDRISNIDATILILGESGTGKSAFAKYIHENSSRTKNPFITINCAAISPNLLESELFGYVPGAFTGAQKNGKIGLVELADGGTLFLDEVGEIPLNLQPKFLELIQDHCFTPVGGTKTKSINVRIISATNQDLFNLVNQKTFREDLYYRLKVIDFEIPSLRERPEDIGVLITYFLEQCNKKYNLNREFSNESLEILMNYSWPGNIRELQHIIEQMVVTASKKIACPNDLPLYIHQNPYLLFNENFKELPRLEYALEQVEKDLILIAYNRLKSSYKIAEALEISQSKANRMIQKYITGVN
ncbi:MAG: PAS domain S-box-containing protein [Clostridium sp.]|jgi:PAS domain S-box-containing protein